MPPTLPASLSQTLTKGGEVSAAAREKNLNWWKGGIGALGATLLLCALLGTFSPSPAKAEYTPFCWNVTLPGAGHNAACDSLNHDHIVRYVAEVGGVGFEHAVCVWAWSNGTKMCSGGPGQGVYNFTPEPSFEDWTVIENIAPGSNRVQAFMDGCHHEGCSGG
jgi:hypothetical protein